MEKSIHGEESESGRSCRSILVLPTSSAGPYRHRKREDGESEVEVIVEESAQNDPPSLLLLTAGVSLLNYADAALVKENNYLKKENKGLRKNYNGVKIKNNELKAKIDHLKAENYDLLRKIRELEAQVAAQNITAAVGEQRRQDQNGENEMGLSYNELLNMNTVKEATYQTGQESDASSVDETTGQEPTLAELRIMNSVRDWIMSYDVCLSPDCKLSWTKNRTVCTIQKTEDLKNGNTTLTCIYNMVVIVYAWSNPLHELPSCYFCPEQ